MASLTHSNIIPQSLPGISTFDLDLGKRDMVPSCGSFKPKIAQHNIVLPTKETFLLVYNIFNLRCFSYHNQMGHIGRKYYPLALSVKLHSECSLYQFLRKACRQ
jgi:hypothetical protein